MECCGLNWQIRAAPSPDQASSRLLAGIADRRALRELADVSGYWRCVARNTSIHWVPNSDLFLRSAPCQPGTAANHEITCSLIGRTAKWTTRQPLQRSGQTRRWSSRTPGPRPGCGRRDWRRCSRRLPGRSSPRHGRFTRNAALTGLVGGGDSGGNGGTVRYSRCGSTASGKRCEAFGRRCLVHAPIQARQRATVANGKCQDFRVICPARTVDGKTPQPHN